MKKLTKLAVVGAAVLVIGATSVTAMAAYGAGPGNMMRGFNNRTYTSARPAADDSQALDALQAQCLERMKTALDAKVAAGTMTQAQEDALLKEMKERQALCTGTGSGSGMMNGQGRYGYGMMGGQSGYGCR